MLFLHSTKSGQCDLYIPKKNPVPQAWLCLQSGDLGSVPGSRKIPWRMNWQPSSLPFKIHGRRSLQCHWCQKSGRLTFTFTGLSPTTVPAWLEFYMSAGPFAAYMAASAGSCFWRCVICRCYFLSNSFSIPLLSHFTFHLLVSFFSTRHQQNVFCVPLFCLKMTLRM